MPLLKTLCLSWRPNWRRNSSEIESIWKMSMRDVSRSFMKFTNPNRWVSNTMFLFNFWSVWVVRKKCGALRKNSTAGEANKKYESINWPTPSPYGSSKVLLLSFQFLEHFSIQWENNKTARLDTVATGYPWKNWGEKIVEIEFYDVQTLTNEALLQSMGISRQVQVEVEGWKR